MRIILTITLHKKVSLQKKFPKFSMIYYRYNVKAWRMWFADFFYRKHRIFLINQYLLEQPERRWLRPTSAAYLFTCEALVRLPLGTPALSANPEETHWGLRAKEVSIKEMQRWGSRSKWAAISKMLVYPQDRWTAVTAASSEAFAEYPIIYLIFLTFIRCLLVRSVT